MFCLDTECNFTPWCAGVEVTNNLGTLETKFYQYTGDGAGNCYEFDLPAGEDAFVGWHSVAFELQKAATCTLASGKVWYIDTTGAW